MLFLILAILGGSALSIMMRLSEGRTRSKTGMFAVNYVACLILCGLYMNFDLALGSPGSAATLGLGTITGVFYVLSLLVMQWNIRKNGVILPSVFSRLGGLLVPLVAAICFFGESPTVLQIIGAVVAVLAILLIQSAGSSAAAASIGPLLCLLMLDGCATTMSTVFEQLGPADMGTQFLFYTFATALVICLVLIVKNKERIGWQEVLFGLGIGIPNFYASRCLLQALDTVPAVIAYPTRGVASIMVVTLAGLVFFRERLTKRQWAAMVAILAAVVLLNI